MKQVSNRRLANSRTRKETGLDYVRNGLNLQTPLGVQQERKAGPYYPGEEDALRAELDKVGELAELIRSDKKTADRLLEVLMCMKDVTGSIARSVSNTLSEVEIFEIKAFLLNTAEIRRIILPCAERVDGEFVPQETEALLDVLDPRGDRMNAFYIYDEFSEKLAGYRSRKRELDREIRKAQKARKEEIRREYGIVLTPKFDIVIPRSSEALDKARKIGDLEAVAEDYSSVTFALTRNEKVYGLIAEQEDLANEIDEEEAEVRARLSARIGEDRELLLENARRIGRLDYVLAKADFAVKHDCVKPEIREEHIVEIVNGRQLQVEDILKSQGKAYCPVSISLGEGVTCITGANMGGKTISLKLSGLVPILAQYGYFVPCESARVGLSNFMQILIGDSQSVERGLSSFGSEMEELREILDNAGDRSLILIDEIASGTNPVEGLALTRSIVDYMMQKPYITLITTHFETVTEEEGVRNMQVRGLADADFSRLDRELRHANRRERIDIISKYMDYRLALVESGREVPKDALNIARMLGIDSEIIEGAKKYIR